MTPSINENENDIPNGEVDYLELPQFGAQYFNLEDAALLAALDEWWLVKGGDDPDFDELVSNAEARKAAQPLQQKIVKALLRAASATWHIHPHTIIRFENLQCAAVPRTTAATDKAVLHRLGPRTRSAVAEGHIKLPVPRLSNSICRRGHVYLRVHRVQQPSTAEQLLSPVGEHLKAQHVDGNVALERSVAGLVHFAHTSLAEQGEYFIVTEFIAC